MHRLAVLLVAGAAGCAALSDERSVPAPEFPSPRIVERVVVAAPKGLVEGRAVELQEVPLDVVRDLVRTVQERCWSWRAAADGGTIYTRAGATVNVYFESAKGRLLRLGLSKDGVVHEVGRHAYCEWGASDYTQALKTLGLR